LVQALNALTEAHEELDLARLQLVSVSNDEPFFDTFPHKVVGDRLVVFLDRFPCKDNKLEAGKAVAVLDSNTGMVYVSPELNQVSPFAKKQGPGITATFLQKHGVDDSVIVTVQRTGRCFQQCPQRLVSSPERVLVVLIEYDNNHVLVGPEFVVQLLDHGARDVVAPGVKTLRMLQNENYAKQQAAEEKAAAKAAAHCKNYSMEDVVFSMEDDVLHAGASSASNSSASSSASHDDISSASSSASHDDSSSASRDDSSSDSICWLCVLPSTPHVLDEVADGLLEHLLLRSLYTCKVGAAILEHLLLHSPYICI
jgi:hypothetical protein